MKKILIILIAVILVALIAFSGWYFFLRIPNVPIGETVRKALPFGSGDNAQLPTANVKQPTAKICSKYQPSQLRGLWFSIEEHLRVRQARRKQPLCAMLTGRQDTYTT